MLVLTAGIRRMRRVRGFWGRCVMPAPGLADRDGVFDGCVPMSVTISDVQPSWSMTENDHATQKAGQKESKQRRHQTAIGWACSETEQWSDQRRFDCFTMINDDWFVKAFAFFTDQLDGLRSIRCEARRGRRRGRMS